jgi:hypothetical protein
MSRRETRARHLLSVLSIAALFVTTLSPTSLSPASAAPGLVTCVNLLSGTERISHTGKCRYSQEAQANWHKNPSDSPIASGPTAKVIVICSNKDSSPVSYQIIRKKCARHQVTTVFSRSGSLPAKPLISEAVSHGYDSASLKLAQASPENLDAPIAFYTITSSRGNIQKVFSWVALNLAISGLQGSTTYSFTVSATTADGTSQISEASLPVTTPAYVPPAPTPVPVAIPAFTLSVVAESKTVNTSISGYSITSTGGAISGYSISPGEPAGTSFSTSTGLLSGTPTSQQSATTYTITASNSSGSASRTFTLTVTAVIYTVGQVGPGGGRIYYVSNSGFNCGSAFTSTGSPTGGLCNYLEVAPSTWSGGSTDPSKKWADTSYVSTDVSGISNEASAANSSAGIGLGYKNSSLIVNQGNTSATAAGSARAYSGGGKSDWYLPTTAELNLLCQWARGMTQDVNALCTSGTNNADFYADPAYWSSSEVDASMARVQYFNNSGAQDARAKGDNNKVRPVRAF